MDKLKRHQITIQQPTATANAAGEPINAWSTFAVRTARVFYMTQSETFISAQEQTAYRVVFVVRYDSVSKAITESMRISWQGRIYDIEAAVNKEAMNREIHIHALLRRQ
jgi:SPP1 family predicted phage head-tail adaptor